MVVQTFGSFGAFERKETQHFFFLAYRRYETRRHEHGGAHVEQPAADGGRAAAYETLYVARESLAQDVQHDNGRIDEHNFP